MRIVQKAVIKRDDKFLVLLHGPKNDPYPDHWDFPGGKLESGEERVKGIIREVKEETGLNVKVGKVVFTFTQGPSNKLVEISVYETLNFSGEVKLSHEHTEFRWAAEEEIFSFEKTEPYLKPYIESL